VKLLVVLLLVVPDLSGMPTDQALAALRAVGLEAVVVTVVDEGPAGHVVTQAPPPGTPVGPAMTPRVYVSSGPQVDEPPPPDPEPPPEPRPSRPWLGWLAYQLVLIPLVIVAARRLRAS